MKYLSIFIRVALLALGQSLDCHSASEVSLMDMGKSVKCVTTTKHSKAVTVCIFLGISWDCIKVWDKILWDAITFPCPCFWNNTPHMKGTTMQSSSNILPPTRDFVIYPPTLHMWRQWPALQLPRRIEFRVVIGISHTTYFQDNPYADE